MPAPSTVHYRHDLRGRLVAAGTTATPKAYGAWTYRGDGATTSEALRTGGSSAEITRRLTQDGLGRLVAITEPAMTQTISYGIDGDAAKPLGDGGVTAEGATYHAAGFPAGAVLPQGSTVTYARDGFGRLTAAISDRPALDLGAAYGPNGNFRSLSKDGLARTYDYAGGTNRLASVSGQSCAHDAAGAVTNAAGTILVHDPATGQMRRGTRAGQTLCVLRDGRGRIVMTAQGTAKRLSLRDGAGIVLWEKDETSAAAVHIHGATGRIGLSTGAASYAVSKDPRGSTRLLYDSDGKAAAWLSYLAYGLLDTAASSASPAIAAIRQRYTGQDWLEPLALYDYGARLYDPALGRFLSPDPADETPSPYMYVGGDPVNAVDPSGMVAIYAVVWKGRKTWKTRVWFLDKDREIQASVEIEGGFIEVLYDPVVRRSVYDGWEQELARLGGRNTTNPVYIPTVDGGTIPGQRPERFLHWLDAVVEDATVHGRVRSRIKDDLKGAHGFAAAKWGHGEAFARMGRMGLTIPELVGFQPAHGYLTPDKTFAMLQAFPPEQYILHFTRSGPVAVPRAKHPYPLNNAFFGAPKKLGPPPFPPKAIGKGVPAPVKKGPGPGTGNADDGDLPEPGAKRRRLE